MNNFNFRSFSVFLDLYLNSFNDYLNGDSYFQEYGSIRLCTCLDRLENNIYTSFMRRWYYDCGFSYDIKPFDDYELAILRFQKMFISAWLAYNDENIFDDLRELLGLITFYQSQYPGLRVVFDYYARYIVDRFLEV